MDVQPGDRIWIAWPRDRGDRGIVVDTVKGLRGQEVYRGRSGSIARLDGYVKRVRVDEDRSATIDWVDGTRTRCRGDECGDGHYYGEIVEVEQAS